MSVLHLFKFGTDFSLDANEKLQISSFVYSISIQLSHKLLPRNLSLAPRFPEAKGKPDFHYTSIFLSFQVIPSVHLIPCQQLRQAFVGGQKILHKRTFCFVLRSKSPLFYNILHVACALWNKADKTQRTSSVRINMAAQRRCCDVRQPSLLPCFNVRFSLLLTRN